MDQRIYMNPVRPLHKTNKSLQSKLNQPVISFQEILKEQVNLNQSPPIQFSKHAEKRLASRNIRLDANRIERLTRAVDQAAQKGARESLILMDNVAYVVSIKNRTVITAVDDESMRDNVFTNIDSAVIVRG
ncbi:hypothetical protein BBF96_11025 [Anoxybacter fermentans]|uniref:Flagellar protein n=1 Tax=Anoxybacter fermentans TaxID=1323375 RepID=A0A3Q9HR34_9FIRM|nr:TIGR02530 family flagellar biosynthesis protein [Anoxybacter fermentans]AZR73873.1 hypothetical protein BBF96_11025 [Anoxybacter fermentans]